jgi:hypothetical protein
METHINTKFVVTEKIIFISTIKHGKNIFCGRKLNKWEMGKMSSAWN